MLRVYRHPDGSSEALPAFGEGRLELSSGSPPRRGAFRIWAQADASSAQIEVVGGDLGAIIEEADGSIAGFAEKGDHPVMVAANQSFYLSGQRASARFTLKECGEAPQDGADRCGDGDAAGAPPSSAHPERPDRAKRPKLEQQRDAPDAPPGPGPGPGGRAAALDSPFGLLEARPGAAMRPGLNSGAMGVSLRRLVAPGFRMALVCNFMIDPQELARECPALVGDQAAEVLLLHGFRDAVLKAAAEAMGAKHWTVRRANVADPWGTHHTKAFILVYDAGLRLIITTANLLHGDINLKTQGVWWQDFPPKHVAGPDGDAAGAAASPFEDDLLLYLRSLEGLPKDAKERLLAACRRHDFSAANAHLLMTVPGRHSGQRLHRFGHMQLRRLLRAEEFPDTFAGAPVAAQFSSIGATGTRNDPDKWLREIAESLGAGITAGSGGRPLGPARELQLVWPTGEEVRRSFEGYDAGGSIPGHSAKLQPVAHLLHRWGGHPAGRERAAPHIKSYCRYSGRRLAWMAVTSCNLSKAAWGELQKGGTQLYCKSYELGVLLLPRLLAESARRGPPFCCTPANPPPSMAIPGACPPSSDSDAGGGGSDLSELQLWSAEEAMLASGDQGPEPRCYLPVPYSLPPAKHGPDDSYWAVDKVFREPDRTGVSYYP